MFFEVQNYLRTGKTLEDLKEEYFIEVRPCESLGVVALNYNQIASPMDQTIPQECRALILELGTWNVVSRSFPKFWNHNEGFAADIDWDSAKIYEKLDGSLISFFFYKDAWRASTRGSADASGNVGAEEFTFRHLVERTIRDMGYSFDEFTEHLDKNRYYSFELTTPENQVLIPHSERKLTLLAVWDKSSGKEYQIEEIVEVKANHVQTYPMKTLDELLEALKNLGQFDTEGYVVCDKDFRRIKIKSPAYLMADRVMSRLATPRRKVELVVSSQFDDVVGILPQFVQDELNEIKQKTLVLQEEVMQNFNDIKHLAVRKDFAQEAIKSKYKAMLFQLLDGKEISQILIDANAEYIAELLGI